MIHIVVPAALVVFIVSASFWLIDRISQRRHERKMALEASRRATKAIESGTPAAQAEEKLKQDLLEIYQGVDTEN